MYHYKAAKMRPLFSSRDLYGILGVREQDGRWMTAAVVAPFSEDREAVDRLAERCTALQLCPEKLIDAVSDFLSQTSADI